MMLRFLATISHMTTDAQSDADNEDATKHPKTYDGLEWARCKGYRCWFLPARPACGARTHLSKSMRLELNFG
jgi:hypothetical protein